MGIEQLRPDLGQTSVIYDDRVDGGVLLNVAGVLEMVRQGDTPQCRAVERAFNAEWRRTEGQPFTYADRQLRCLQHALKEIGCSLSMMGEL